MMPDGGYSRPSAKAGGRFVLDHAKADSCSRVLAAHPCDCQPPARQAQDVEL
jgi:hypothetical protein